MRYTTPRLQWERPCLLASPLLPPEEGTGGRLDLRWEEASLQRAGLLLRQQCTQAAGAGQKLGAGLPPRPGLDLAPGQEVYIAKRPVPIRPQASCSHNRQARGAPLGLCRSEPRQGTPRQGTDLAGASPAFLTALSRSFSKCTDFLPEAPTETGGSTGHVSAWLCPSLQGGQAV